MSSSSKSQPGHIDAPTLVPEDELEIEIEDSDELDEIDELEDSEDSEDFEQVAAILGARARERQTVHVVTLLQPRSRVESLNLSVHEQAPAPSDGDHRHESDDDLAAVLMESTQDLAQEARPGADPILSELDGLQIVEAAPGQWSGTYAPAPMSEVATFEDTAGISPPAAPAPTLAAADREDLPGSLEDLDRLLAAEEASLGEDSLELELGESWLFDEISVDLATSPPPRHRHRELEEVFDEICIDLLDVAPHPAETVDFFSLPDDAFVPGGTLQPPEVSPGFHTGIARAARRTVVRARAGRIQGGGIAA